MREGVMGEKRKAESEKLKGLGWWVTGWGGSTRCEEWVGFIGV